MPITKPEDWQESVDKNKDPYGDACVKVARRVMEILDEEPGEFDCHKIITRADHEALGEADGGIPGFTAGAVASMVSHCHSRGEEFRRKWNLHTQIGNEGEKANESGGVLNPALLNFDTGAKR